MGGRHEGVKSMGGLVVWHLHGAARGNAGGGAAPSTRTHALRVLTVTSNLGCQQPLLRLPSAVGSTMLRRNLRVQLATSLGNSWLPTR